MNALAIALLVATQSGWNVGGTFWDPPGEIIFRADTRVAAAFAGVTPSTNQTRIMYDRACVIWGRAGILWDETSRCRSTGNTNTTPGGDGFNFADNIDAIAFSSPSGAGGAAWCDPFTGIPQANECDIWLQSNANSWIVSTTTPNTTFTASGFPNVNFFQNTLLHEVGHTLGGFHPVTGASGAVIFETTCTPGGYNCPVMSQATQRDAYWPTIDDIEAMDAKHGNHLHDVEARLFNVSATGALSSATGWFQVGQLRSFTLPRISCRPDDGTGTRSCILSLPQSVNSNTATLASTTPEFWTLNVTATNVTVQENDSGSTVVDGPVDIAYGDLNRYFAIGHRRADGTSPQRIVTYAGTVGDPPVEVTLPASNANRTHTEPRVSFNEEACVFVAAWPRRNTAVEVATFDINGGLVDQVVLDGVTAGTPATSATTPVEVSCPNHTNFSTNFPWPNSSTCKLYVINQDGSQNFLNGQFQTIDVEVSHGTFPLGAPGSCGFRAGKGNIISTTVDTYSSMSADALIVDATRFGAPSLTGPEGFMLTTDRVASSATSNPIRVRLDSDGDFNGSILSSTTWSMNTQNEDDGMVNLTTWDWNETTEMFVALRAARARGF